MDIQKLKYNLLKDSRIFSHKCDNDEEYISFVNWLIENGRLFNDLLTSIPENIVITKSAAANCYQNSQLVSLENPGIKYSEGIWILENGSLDQHGFNLIGDEVLDVTFLKNKDEYMQDAYYSPTLCYFGITIDSDYFMENKRTVSDSYLDNPLLYELFKQTAQKKPLD